MPNNPSRPADAAWVVFTPSGRRGQVPMGTTVLAAARQLGVDLDSVCGGRGLCTKCQCTIMAGEFPKHGIFSSPEHLEPETETENAQRVSGALGVGRRLSCAARVRGDVLIDVPPESQTHRQVVRKEAEARDIELHPLVRLYVVDVAEPDMHDPTGDVERLFDALEFEWGLTNLHVGHGLLGRVQSALRQGKWSATVAIRDATEVVAIWPGVRASAYGVAIDIGSTTIAAHLCDLATGDVKASAGLMNPQIRFGEDLMSRVSYVMMNGPTAVTDLTQAVREAVDGLLFELSEAASIAREDIIEAVAVGNPIMHHLFLGIDPTELGGAPFALATDRAVSVSALELGFALNPATRFYCLPCIAGHVGADCAAVALAERPDLSDDTVLVVDIGTNAEIMLGNRQQVLACSSPTGPAFEGAQITHGQRAAPGAIERVRINPDTGVAKVKVIGCERWSDEPGFDAGVADTGVTGICGSGIIEAIAEMFLAGIVNPEGVIEANAAFASVVEDGRTYAYILHTGEHEIRVTQADIRAIQLAKAALYAGCQLLMDRLRIDAPDRIRLAGAFGSHIDVKYAMVLGLIPDCALERVSPAGNAAGTGARIALLDYRARRDIESVVRRIEKVETAVEPSFQAHFVDAMSFPHGRRTFSALAQSVVLPSREATASRSAGSRPRRRRRRAAVSV
ncbi:MAG: ASKHA domain-containing protein [Pseudomonadota bacterium]